jgi:glycine/D-amino acid oxidase-like deaminating enzyme
MRTEYCSCGVGKAVALPRYQKLRSCTPSYDFPRSGTPDAGALASDLPNILLSNREKLCVECGRHEGLWFNFGHGHPGLTMSATTGEIIAREIARNTALFVVDRFAA